MAYLITAATFAAARPHLNSGACLSCHAQQLATLPENPACRAISETWISWPGTTAPGTQVPYGSWARRRCGSSALLLLLGLSGIRRLAPAVGVLALAALAFRGGNQPPRAPLPGAVQAARGWACDLSPKVSPDGGIRPVRAKGPDTTGDGRVDMRDGLALFSFVRTGPLPSVSPPTSWMPKLPWLYGLRTERLRGSRAWRVGGLQVRGRRMSRMASQGGEVHSPAFSPDGLRIACVEGLGIGVLDLATGQRMGVETDPGRHIPPSFRWSP